MIKNLQELESSQHFSGTAVPAVDLVVLQLGREARGAVVLIGHFYQWLGKCPAHEVGFALKAQQLKCSVHRNASPSLKNRDLKHPCHYEK